MPMKQKSTLLHLVLNDFEQNNTGIYNLKDIISEDKIYLSKLLNRLNFAPKNEIIDNLLKKADLIISE